MWTIAGGIFLGWVIIQAVSLLIVIITSED